MGKRQHQKDKMYLTYTEWSTLYGGKKYDAEHGFRRLPFYHCCVSLRPIEDPYCDADGNIFEYKPLLLYLKKYKKNPVTGKPLDVKSLIKLNFTKNSEGQYVCPVLQKVLTKNSHIVAIATTGNVFSNDAVEELNVKTKNWTELITGEPFTRKDIIVIQNPSDLNKFNMSHFYHIVNDHKITELEIAAEEGEVSKPSRANLKSINMIAQEVLKEIDESAKEETVVVEKTKSVADKFNAAHYSTGAVAASFTSTAMNVETTHEAAILDEDVVRYERVKKKGYLRLVTNYGPLNIELHCDLVPKTCENFLKHCQNNYYNSTVFHRSIKHFILQGGDPTGTGTGGESIWGGAFEDEIKPNLTHTGRGILSMANSGKNTNKSQFFITYRSAKHLDGKHTVFGRIVGGLETLSAIERIPTDSKDRPKEQVILERTQIFVDPYTEADERLAQEREAEREKEAEAAAAESRAKKAPLKVFKTSGVGKYLNIKAIKDEFKDGAPSAEGPAVKKKKIGYNLNFDNW